jgi:tRNA (mo5U34)-methyltransferase
VSGGRSAKSGPSAGGGRFTKRGPSAAGRPAAADLRARVAALGEWFHNFDLDGVQTAPDHPLGDYPRVKFARFAAALPARLDGATVLDVGCNAGFYALEMKRRGAARVVGIDSDPRYLAQAGFAAEYYGLDVELARLSVYDVARLGQRFDLVLFMGVLYHLRHPLLALDRLHDHVVGDRLVVQSMLRGSAAVAEVAADYPFHERAVFDDPGWPRLHFVEHRFARDPTNWWIPNRAGLEAMLRSAGFRVEAHPEDEVFLCRRLPERGHDDAAPGVG